jgi:hypothetical protein
VETCEYLKCEEVAVAGLFIFDRLLELLDAIFLGALAFVVLFGLLLLFLFVDLARALGDLLQMSFLHLLALVDAQGLSDVSFLSGPLRLSFVDFSRGFDIVF